MPTPSPIADAALALLARRGSAKSVCPSEVARACFPDTWRDRMPAVRAAARRLAREGRLRITQGEITLDPDGAWTGPIRLRLPESADDENPPVG